MVQLRLNAIAPASKSPLTRIERDADAERSRAGTRKVYWGPDAGFVETPVYRRETMGAGIELAGPVLCEAEDTVIVTPPGWRFRTDEWGVGWVEKL
jgi:N-methylhydantoinase A